VIAQRLARLDGFEPRRATLTALRSASDDEVLDQVLLTCFPAPHSLTGDHVVEISCHGSPAIVRRIIDATLEWGAVLAGPGEFTLRAVMNGKIDLAQAEAIRDLIAAQTEAAVKQASRQLNGELSQTLGPLKENLVEVIVLLESALEFVEDDLPAPQLDRLAEILEFVIAGLDRLSESYKAGRLLRDGARVAITGRPNVGKSSLFNKLIHSERAIVTDIPGTTRDTLSESIDIGGVPVVLTDTAGLRETTDGVETLGIERTHRAMGEADLVLLVLDGASGFGPEDRALLARTTESNRIVVMNKCDVPSFQSLARCDPGVEAINVSARTGDGLSALHSAIVRRLNSAGRSSPDENHSYQHDCRQRRDS
jgi:tRNA modification GTPase